MFPTLLSVSESLIQSFRAVGESMTAAFTGVHPEVPARRVLTPEDDVKAMHDDQRRIMEDLGRAAHKVYPPEVWR